MRGEGLGRPQVPLSPGGSFRSASVRATLADPPLATISATLVVSGIVAAAPASATFHRWVAFRPILPGRVPVAFRAQRRALRRPTSG